MSVCQNRLGPFEYSTIMRPISLNLKLRNFLFSLFSFTDLMLLMLLMLEIASTVSIILKFKIRSLSFKWNWLNKRGKFPTQNRKLIKITSKQCWVRLYCHIFLENLSMHSVSQRAPKSLLQCDWWLTYSTSLIKKFTFWPVFYVIKWTFDHDYWSQLGSWSDANNCCILSIATSVTKTSSISAVKVTLVTMKLYPPKDFYRVSTSDHLPRPEVLVKVFCCSVVQSFGSFVRTLAAY